MMAISWEEKVGSRDGFLESSSEIGEEEGCVFLVVRGCGPVVVPGGVANGGVEWCSVKCVRSGEVTLTSVCDVVVIGFGVTRGIVRSIKGVCFG